MHTRVALCVAMIAWASAAAGQNMLLNAGFDLDPTTPGNGWTVSGTGAVSYFTNWGYPTPPSVSVDCSGDESVWITQCVEVDSGEPLDFSAFSYTHFGGGYNGITLSFYASADCSGAALETVPTTGLSFPDWAYRWAESVLPPVGAGSARFELGVDALGSAAATVSWDTAYLGPSATIFADDFETGDTTAWSATAP